MKKAAITSLQACYNIQSALTLATIPRPKHYIIPNLGVVKYKLSASFRNLCNSCISVCTLLLLSCVHSLGLELDLGSGE